MTRLNFNMFKFPRVTRLPMFQTIHNVDWSNLKVLDYGGNHGNLLKDGIESGQIKPENYTTAEIGILTLKDILKELEKPGLDPRKAAKIFEFDPNVRSIKDLKTGMILPGIVNNITAFGCFVDVDTTEDEK